MSIAPVRTLKLVLLACSAATACGGPSGAAPAATDLSYNPKTTAVGQQTTFSGTFAFADPDGDVLTLNSSLQLPSGQKQNLPSTAVPGAASQRSGTVSFAVALVPPTSGRYDLALWLVDGAGHESNQLNGAIEVVDTR